MCTWRKSRKIHTGGAVRTSGTLTQRKKALFSASCGLTACTTNGYQPSLSFRSQHPQKRRAWALLRLCGSRGGGGRGRREEGRDWRTTKDEDLPHLRTRETPTHLLGLNPHVGC